jgi:hypothetical protein
VILSKFFANLEFEGLEAPMLPLYENTNYLSSPRHHRHLRIAARLPQVSEHRNRQKMA